MQTYTVTWTIQVDAETHHAAAEQALAIQRDPESTALVFDVKQSNVRHAVTRAVDLMPE